MQSNIAYSPATVGAYPHGACNDSCVVLLLETCKMNIKAYLWDVSYIELL